MGKRFRDYTRWHAGNRDAIDSIFLIIFLLRVRHGVLVLSSMGAEQATYEQDTTSCCSIGYEMHYQSSWSTSSRPVDTALPFPNSFLSLSHITLDSLAFTQSLVL